MFDNPETAGLMNIASQQLSPSPMASRSGLDILSIQNDLKNMSDEQLGLAMQSGTPTYLVASEKNRRVNMRKDFEARKSAQEGTVVEDLFRNQQPLAMGRMQQSFQPSQQGLGSLPGSSEQPVMQMQDGGLISFIKEQEFFQPTIYNDTGSQAIGYGYNLSPEELEQGFVTLSDGTQVPLEGGITEEAASSLLEQRLRDNARVGTSFLKEAGVDVDNLSPNVRDALQDLTYQTGGGIFNKSPRLVQALKDNDKQAIAEELRTTGRLVGGEVLPGAERRANLRADMVSGGSGGFPNAIERLANLINPISSAQAQDLGGEAEVITGEPQENVVDVLGPSFAPVYAPSRDQAIDFAIAEYDATLANEQDQDRSRTLLELMGFEDDSNQDRLDALEAIGQYGGPRREGGGVSLRSQREAAEFANLIERAKLDKDLGEKVIGLARSGTLTLDSLRRVVGGDGEGEGEGAIVAGETIPGQGAPEDVTTDGVDAGGEEVDADEAAEQSARQLAFLEAALRVGSSDSPTLAGALGEAVPAIESYRDELDNISQRKYRDAQAEYYASGGTQSQQYNSVIRQVKPYIDSLNDLPTPQSAINVLTSVNSEDPAIAQAVQKLRALPPGISTENAPQIKAIVQNALTQHFARQMGLTFVPGGQTGNQVGVLRDVGQE